MEQLSEPDFGKWEVRLTDVLKSKPKTTKNLENYKEKLVDNDDVIELETKTTEFIYCPLTDCRQELPVPVMLLPTIEIMNLQLMNNEEIVYEFSYLKRIDYMPVYDDVAEVFRIYLLSLKDALHIINFIKKINLDAVFVHIM